MADGTSIPRRRERQPPGSAPRAVAAARARAPPAAAKPIVGPGPGAAGESWRAMALSSTHTPSGAETPMATPPEPAAPAPPVAMPPAEGVDRPREEGEADWAGAAAEQLQRRRSAPPKAKAADEGVAERTGRTPHRERLDASSAEREPPPSLLTGRPIHAAARFDPTREALFSDLEGPSTGSGGEGGVWAMLDEILGAPAQGEPLPGDERRLLEALFGADLGDVRVHPGGDAATVVDAAGAEATTVGRDIAFAPGAYRPGDPDGLNLLAHEVAHAVQQGPAPADPDAAGERPDIEVSPHRDPVPAEASAEVEPSADPAVAAPSEVEIEGAGGPAAETLQLPDTLATPPAMPPIAGAGEGAVEPPPVAAEAAAPPSPSEAPESVEPIAPTPAAAAPVRVGPDPLPAWSSRVAAATTAVHARPPTPGGGGVIRRTGGAASSSLDRAAARVPADASRVVTPPDRPTDLPEPPDQATGAALSAVQAAGGHPLSAFTLPVLPSATPLGRAVALVTAGPGAPTPSTTAPSPTGDAAPPTTGAPAAARGADRLGAALGAPVPTISGGATTAPPLGTTVSDTPPEAPALTVGSQRTTGQAIARLLLQVNEKTNDLVGGVLATAYRGGVATWTALADPIKPDERTGVAAELRRVAAAAQISDTQLETHLADQRRELTARHTELSAERTEAAAGAAAEVRTAGASLTAEVDSARASLDRAAADRVAAARGDVDVTQVNAERDRLLRRVDTLETQAASGYRGAVQRFKDALDAEAGRQRQAYQRAADADREGLRAGKTTTEELLEAERGFQPVRIWRDDQLRELQRQLEFGKTAADTQSSGFTDTVRDRAREARESVRDWAAHRIGYERSWLQRLFDWISDWRHQADRESAAWQEQQTQETLRATLEGVSFIDAEVVRLRGMSEAERTAEFSNLTAEQQAIVMAYFQSGGDRIEAVAAGLMSRISAQRRPEILSRIEAAVLASNDDEKMLAAATAVNPSFDEPRERELCRQLRSAFTGPGTEEPDVFAALRGLSALEGKLVERKYAALHNGESLRERLRSELDDWATWSSHDIDRANAMLDGHNADAIAVELDQAMHGTWNGLGVGTDNDTIMRALRGKSPSEIADIRRAYRTRYGRDLQTEVAGELNDWFVAGTHDVDRFNALMASDTAAADAVAVDQAMHGGAMGLGIGTDRAAIDGVYSQIDREIDEEATRNNWSSARVETERRRRRLAVSGSYETRYGGGTRRADGRSALDAAFEDDSSDADLALFRGVSGSNRDLTREGLDYASINASRIALERQAIFYHDDKVIQDAMQEPQQRLTAERLRDLNLDIGLQQQIDREAVDRGHFTTAWDSLRAAMNNTSGTPEERRTRTEAAFRAFNGALGRSGSLGASEGWGAVSMVMGDPNASPAAVQRALDRFRARWVTPERGRPTTTELAYHDSWSPEATMRRRAEARTQAASYAAERAPAEFNAMRDYYNAHYANRPAAAMFELQDQGGDFDADVRAMTSSTGVDRRMDPATGRVILEDKTAALLRQGGVLSDTQEVTFAARGMGTDMNVLRRVAAGRSREEMQVLAANWEREHPGESFNDLLFGTNDPERNRGSAFGGEFSGRDWEDMRELFVFGEPVTPTDRAARAERQLAFEAASTNSWSSDELGYLREDVAALHADIASFNAADKAARQPGHENDFEAWQTYERRLASVEANARAVDAAVSLHRRSVDVVADVAGQIIGGVVIAAAAIAGAVASVLSGGTLSGAAIALIALTASLVGSALSMGAKAYYKGAAYGWEEVGVDLATAVVDAIVSYATAGIGDKLLKNMTVLKGLAGRGGASRWLAAALSEGIENTLGTLPSTFTGVLLDSSTYEGNPLLNLLTGTLMGTAQSLVVAGVMGKVIGGPMGRLGTAMGEAHVSMRSRPTVPSVHGGPRVPPSHPDAVPDFHGPNGRERVRAWVEFRAEHPKGTLNEFRAHLEAATDAVRADALAQGPRRRAELLSALPPERHAEFAGVPIDVVGPNEYRSKTGRDPEASHAAVVFDGDGRPRIVVQPDTPAHALQEEGLHLLQRTEAGHKERIASFERLTPETFHALSIEARVEAVRNYLEVELNAQERLRAAVEADLHSADPTVRARAQEAAAHFEEKAELYRRQLETLGRLTPERLAEMARDPSSLPPLLREAPVLQQKKSVIGHRPNPASPTYGVETRQKVKRSRSSYDGHTLIDAHPDAELQQVGRPWFEEDSTGDKRRYRRAELVDAQGRVIHTREEIESPAGSGRWRQRGSESALAGGIMEVASAEFIKQQIAEHAKHGREVIQIDAKHRGNAGFDNVKIEFYREGRALRARIIQVEVKDYSGHVGFSAFTANAVNLPSSIESLGEVLKVQSFPSPAHRRAATEALRARRFGIEVHTGPTTTLGTAMTSQRGVLAKIERVQRILFDLERIEAALPARRGSEVTAIRDNLLRAIHPDNQRSEVSILRAMKVAEGKVSRLAAPMGVEVGEWRFAPGLNPDPKAAFDPMATFDLRVAHVPQPLIDAAKLASPAGRVIGQNFDVHPLRLAERQGILTPGRYHAEAAPTTFGDGLHIIADSTGKPVVLNQPGRPGSAVFDPRIEAQRLIRQARHQPTSVGKQAVNQPLSPLVDVSHLAPAQIESLTVELVTAAGGNPSLLGQIRLIAPPATMTPKAWGAMFATIAARNRNLSRYLSFKHSVIVGQP